MSHVVAAPPGGVSVTAEEGRDDSDDGDSGDEGEADGEL